MSEQPSVSPKHPRLFTRVLHKLYGIWFWLVFSVLATITLCLIAVLPNQTRRRSIVRLGARGVLRFSGSWPKIKGLEQLPDQAGVVVANHASYLDGIVLHAVLPKQYRFVIKREVTKVPLMNFYLQRIGAHFVERFDPRKGASDTRKIMKTTANGDSLAFFPEGTFLAEPGLRRFHSGAFKVATRKGMPVIPLTINGTRTMLPANRLLPRPTPLTVIIAKPYGPNPDSDAAAALDHCRQSILATLDEPDLLEVSN